jgi:hypothetical protein
VFDDKEAQMKFSDERNAQTSAKLKNVLERITSDEKFARKLQKDPVGTLISAKFRPIEIGEFLAELGLPGLEDENIKTRGEKFKTDSDKILEIAALVSASRAAGFVPHELGASAGAIENCFITCILNSDFPIRIPPPGLPYGGEPSNPTESPRELNEP